MVVSLLATSLLTAAPKAVVFDWGKVMAHPDRKQIVSFLSDSLQITPQEFEELNLKKKNSKNSEIDYWLSVANERKVVLPNDWVDRYRAVSKEALNVDPKMYALVNQLKAKGHRVALLSNIEKRYGDLIKNYGFYEPFSPCVLSGEIGISKPDPKAYEHLLSELSLSASDILFVDDLKENVEAAHRLGIDAILFESIDQLKKELSQRGVVLD